MGSRPGAGAGGAERRGKGRSPEGGWGSQSRALRRRGRRDRDPPWTRSRQAAGWVPGSSGLWYLSDSGYLWSPRSPSFPTRLAPASQRPFLSDRVGPGSLHVSSLLCPESLSHAPLPHALSRSPSLFSACRHFPSSLAPSSLSLQPVSASPPAPRIPIFLCLSDFVSVSFPGLLSTDLCPSERLRVAPPPHPGPQSVSPCPYSHSGPGWRGGVGGRCSGSCVFPAQNRLLLPWRRERGLRDAKHQAGG